MHILKKKTILEYVENHPDAKNQLLSWYHDANSSDWKEPLDIKRTYSNVDFVGDKVVVFDIKGNTYRLIVRVEYQFGKVFIRWFGTHAEYDKLSDVAQI
ncbi:MAG: mRNA interferase toxin HigB [Chloroflexi bacterium]|nr:mRNA interferase toxin HigB [Chloroflexota bacterium]